MITLTCLLKTSSFVANFNLRCGAITGGGSQTTQPKMKSLNCMAKLKLAGFLTNYGVIYRG